MNLHFLHVRKRMPVLLCLFISSASFAQLKPALADSFLNFILANRNKASVYISRNDTTIAALNEDKLMPLASTVKIMVAVEFAQQSAQNVINENSYIPLSELNKYYIPNTDGGAHTAWLDYSRQQKLLKGDSVKLIDVARGMIIFSSNANTEYLMDLLGFDNVKENISLFGLKQHTAISPIVGSLFLYQFPKKTTEDKLIKSISSYSDKKYSMEAYARHLDLKEDSSLKAKYRPEEFSMKLQKLWSDRLPASTTRDYVQLVKALNKREILDEKAFFSIAEILEYPMENKAFQAVFKHYGVKGGSTGFVLTHVIYFTTKSGVRMESAIFFNDLSPEEEQKLEGWLDPFEAQIIFDRTFREKLKF